MKEIRSILVPVDFSDSSRAGLQLAMEIAEKFGAKVTLLHVWGLPVYAFPEGAVFGPEVVTLDEFLGSRALEEVEVATFLDATEIRRNVVGNMTHAPRDLVSFHSQMMPLFPGDIISTGTPGAGVLEDGVVAEARIDGLLPLTNPVRGEHR